jgi:hypothetical protein
MHLDDARSLFSSNLYSLTAALLGVTLLCWAALDWVAYSGFVVSLLWR